MLLLDRVPNITEGDERNYHEMMGHVPVVCHPNPKKVLIIGGGDGGAAREIFKHDSIEKIVLVDIDGDVIDVCKKFFPNVASSFNDPRMECIVGDGIDYVNKAADKSFDIIIVDSTDPGGPSVPLFSVDFYTQCKRILADDGVVIAQAESPVGFSEEVFVEVMKKYY